MDENGGPSRRRRLLSYDSHTGLTTEVPTGAGPSQPPGTAEAAAASMQRELLQIGAGPPQTTRFGLKTGLSSSLHNTDVDPMKRIM